MKLVFLERGKRREFEKFLEKHFGIPALEFVFVESEMGKIRAFSGNLSKNEILELSRHLNIEGFGIYFAKRDGNEIRLRLDAVHLLSEKISKGILDISIEEREKWMRGENLDCEKSLKGIFIIKCGNDFLSSAKAVNGKLFNFVPKERRTGF